MRILFVADGRSPIALNWMSYFVDSNHEIHLATTFACEPDLKFTSIHLVPVAFSELKSQQPEKPGRKRIRSYGNLVRVGLRTNLRHWIGPFTLLGAAKQLRGLIDRLRPDLVHAMRIPYEGMLAAQALSGNTGVPFIVSVWGNDLTLHAPSTPWMSSYTRQTLKRTNGLHVDCKRDLRLASNWGYTNGKPAIVLPGNGGIRLDEFFPPRARQGIELETIINPRGIRTYIRNDTFFQAARQVLDRRPTVKFICPAMAGEPEAEKWVQKFGLRNSVEILPKVTRNEMGDLYRRSVITVSPSVHDGTPNTLLEGMACGCFPIAGDIESLKEWITSERNGLLFDPSDPTALSDAILSALDHHELMQQAGEINVRMVSQRAEYFQVMHNAEQFYAEASR
jgi:glycosyltransferase involved in cell wall biosynthesis